MNGPALPVARPDRAAVAAMLGRAFADDPAFSWIYPDPADRARRLPRLFGLFLDADNGGGMALRSSGGEAASLWQAPGTRAAPGRFELLRRAWPLWRALGTKARRAFAVGEAIDAHKPDQPFWYLHVLGCDPAAQGRGLGGAMVRAGLSRAAGRLPCYLETATEANLGFYAALGFGVTADWRVPGGGPRFWSMLRPRD